MPRYQVTKTLRLQYDVEADNEDSALQVPWPKDDPQAVTVVKERARDLDKKPAGIRTITDRELRPGRTLVARLFQTPVDHTRPERRFRVGLEHDAHPPAGVDIEDRGI